MEEIKSYNDLMTKLEGQEKVYVLIYKGEGELGNCAKTNLCAARNRNEKAVVYGVDVTEIRDIHTKFDISTAPSLLEFEKGSLKNVIKGCMTEDYYNNLLQQSFSVISSSDKPQKRVIVYSTPTCSWCGTLKTHLRKNNIRFTENDVASNPEKAEEMKRKSGQMGVPQTDIGGQMIVGFDKNRINTLLGIN